MAVEREKIYECEVKRRRVKEGGGYEPFWKVKSIADALADSDTEFRCKEGSVPYVEHKSTADSEYCVNGLLFKKATDGREPRHSTHPVE
jgi:hypothetical protein